MILILYISWSESCYSNGRTHGVRYTLVGIRDSPLYIVVSLACTNAHVILWLSSKQNCRRTNVVWLTRIARVYKQVMTGLRAMFGSRCACITMTLSSSRKRCLGFQLVGQGVAGQCRVLWVWELTMNFAYSRRLWVWQCAGYQTISRTYGQEILYISVYSSLLSAACRCLVIKSKRPCTELSRVIGKRSRPWNPKMLHNTTTNFCKYGWWGGGCACGCYETAILFCRGNSAVGSSAAAGIYNWEESLKLLTTRIMD